MELLGDRSWCSIPNRIFVYHGNRHYFHTGVGEKTLFCLPDRFDPEMPFGNGDLRFLCEVEDNVSCNPVQQAAGKCRGAEAPCLDEKEIADGAFSQVRFPVEQDAIEGAGRDGFPFGQNIVQEVGGFDLGRNGAGQVPSGFGNDQLHAGLILLG